MGIIGIMNRRRFEKKQKIERGGEIKLVEENYNSRKLETNSNSIITLTLGILSILIPLLGLFLGIIGLVVYRKARNEIALTGEGGKGLAISGLICSIVGILSQLFMILMWFLFSSIAFFDMAIM